MTRARVIVDTNVPKVANGMQDAPHATNACIAICVSRIRDIQIGQILVLDKGWQILREYIRELRSEGQPGVGDAFLKWVLTNQYNPKHCEHVSITPDDSRGYVEFPDDPQLAVFDLADRKFVAVARSHPAHPPILNAVDNDWWVHRAALEAHDVRIEFLCPEHMGDTTDVATG